MVPRIDLGYHHEIASGTSNDQIHPIPSRTMEDTQNSKGSKEGMNQRNEDEDTDSSINWEDGDPISFTNHETSLDIDDKLYMPTENEHSVAVEQTLAVMENTRALIDGTLDVHFHQSHENDNEDNEPNPSMSSKLKQNDSEEVEQERFLLQR